MTKQPPGPSVNARKYGPWKRNPNISGLTPLPSLFPKSRFDLEEQNTRTRIEKFQRRIFHTFTARELANMDVITDRELSTPNLDNPVMPMLRQNRWEIRPSQPQFTRDNMYPLIIDGKTKGEWSMHNPLVFEIMKPILRLATRTLNSMYTLPWFGALLFGDRFPIDERRKRPEDFDKISRITTSFHPYNYLSHEKVQVRMEKVFDDLEKVWNLTFGFMMPNEDPRGSEHNDDDDCNDEEDDAALHGICVTNYAQMKYAREKDQAWGVWIFLSYKQVETLFRKDLTSAEKRMVEWAAAVTIVHEIIHAITYIAPGNHITPEQNLYEDTPPPFFDQEPLAEAGFSFEAALNGGICKDFVLSKSGLPYGHWFETLWPTVEAQELCASEAITLTNPDPFLYQELFPIPVSFYDEMQQKGFWDGIVKRYGHQLFRFRFVNEGARINFALEESIETPILFQATTPTRLPKENSHLELTSENLRDRWGKVNELRNLQGTLQHDREVEVFAQEFLASSKTGNNFWNQMQNQNLSANSIIQEMLRGNMSNQEQAERLAQLVELILTIVLNHEKTIDLLLAGDPPQEPNFVRPFQERKNILLLWNRGTNVFISECKQQQQMRRNPDHIRQLIFASISLEICRMRLFTPDLTQESQSSPLDFHEYAITIKLESSMQKRQSLQSHELCSKLRAVEGCSLFAKLCVQFSLLLMQQWEEFSKNRPWEFENAKREYAIFSSLKERAPTRWRKTLAFWEVAASEALKKLRFYET